MGTANTSGSHQAPAPIPAPIQSNQGSIIEPRPIAESGGHEDVFLSPRVLDAGAFTRYSEMLKSIITQASAKGRTLEDFSTDAQAMIQRCESTSESINKRMQAGVRMLKMIDERATRTEKLLDNVQSALPDTEGLGKQIDAMIEQRLASSQQRIEEIVAQAEQRVKAAQSQTNEAIAMSEGHAKKLADLTRRIEGQLSELDARIEHTRENTSVSLRDLIDQTNEAREELGTSIDRVLERAHESGATLALKIDEASMLSDARLAELNRSIEPVLEASQKAMRTLGMDPENPVFEDSPLSRIERLVERGETQSASLDRVYRQLEDLQSQAEGVKAVFGLWLVDAAADLDVLEERKEHIVGPMSTAAATIAELSPDLEHKLELASTQLAHLQIEQQALRLKIEASSSVATEVSQRMTNESGQIQALLDGSVHKLSTRVEQAGVWLGALIQRAEELGGSLPQAGMMEFGNAVSVTDTPSAIESPMADERKNEVKIESPIAESKEVGTGIVAPQPPCLPIDALSFEGASMVIEHKHES